MTDDVIYSTQYYIMYINRLYFGQFAARTMHLVLFYHKINFKELIDLDR